MQQSPCALCNFGKDRYTLAQLGLDDPRLRAPQYIDWDGLERFQVSSSDLLSDMRRKPAKVPKVAAAKTVSVKDRSLASIEHPTAFFLPDTWISKGYVYTPKIGGKERWFQISSEMLAESVDRGGVAGVRLVCNLDAFVRRGIDPNEFKDID